MASGKIGWGAQLSKKVKISTKTLVQMTVGTHSSITGLIACQKKKQKVKKGRQFVLWVFCLFN